MNLLLVVLCSWLFCRIWTIWLYPKLFSPLNRLPQLKEDQNVSMATRILREPSGRQTYRRLEGTQHASVGLVRSKGILGGERVIVTSDEALGEILRQPDLYEIPPQRRLVTGHLLGDGLLAASGETHKYQRKNLAPAFAHANIRKSYGLFWEKAFELVMLLSKEPKLESGSSTVDIHAWVGRLAMDNIGVAAFGTDFGLLVDDQTEFSTYFSLSSWKGSVSLGDSLASKYLYAFGANPINGTRIKLSFLLPGWLFERLPLKTKALQEASAFIRAKCAECIDQARIQNERKASSHAETICRVALDSKAFSDHNLEDQLMTILASGHSTSQTALSSTAALLCQHQEIQHRLRTEIAQLLSASESESDDTIAKVVQHPYLQAVCHESLRLFPPVTTVQRRSTLSTTLLGYVIPKHTLLVVSPWIVHRDPMHWGPDACEFRPTRWLDGAAGGVSDSFLTFTHGPRNCIGQVFASAELAISVAVLVSKFQLKMGEKAPVWENETVSKPTDGVEVVLTPIPKP